MTHLWEVDHDYYCSEAEYHEVSDSWAEFFEEFGDADKDYNLLFRWDWVKPDPEYFEGEELPSDVLRVFFVAQRKGYLFSRDINVTEADEPAVRSYLSNQWEHLKGLWSPL